jgi:NAD(P)-dependent dehydrogenase (short-subunit alcohol dehydrogenase family)
MQIETEADIPDQSGRLAVVTGATGGLGFEVARMLAQAGAHVVLVGRNAEKGAAAIRRLASLNVSGKLTFERIDLADLADVAAGAARIAAQYDRVDLLVNNAGVMAPPERKTTTDGFELQFGTNHLAHFALTGYLLPLLRKAPGARVVAVASLAARYGRIDFGDLQHEHGYNPMRVYGQSKLANLLFSYELQRLSQAREWGVTAVSAHPGLSRTDLFRNGPGEMTGVAGFFKSLAMPMISLSAAEGALPIICAALCDDVEPDAFIGPGRLFELKNPPGEARRLKKSRDPEVAARLWQVSEKLTGVVYPQ